MKNKLGFSAVALVIILAVLAVGGYVVWKNQNSVSTPAAPVDTNIEPPISNLPLPTSDIQNWKIYSDGNGNVLYKYPQNWTAKNFYYIGSRYPERYDSKELPAGVDFISPSRNPKDMISLGIRVSMDPAKCNQYPREKATKCITSDLISFGGVRGGYGGIMWTQSSNPEVLRVFDIIVASLSTSTADNTVSRKTYRNDKYRFEFQYPANLVGHVSDNNGMTLEGPCLVGGVYDTQQTFDANKGTDNDASGIFEFCVVDTSSNGMTPKSNSSYGRVLPLSQKGQFFIFDSTVSQTYTGQILSTFRFTK